MATGVFFVFALKYASESSAAAVAFLGLLTTAAVSPLAGRLLDSGLLTPPRVAAAYGLSGCLMGLLLTARAQPFALAANVVAATALALPAHLQLTRASSALLHDRPGTGFGLFSCVCTAGTLLGALAGSALVSRAAWVPAWAWLKLLGSLGAGLALTPVLRRTAPPSAAAGGPPVTTPRVGGTSAHLRGLAAAVGAFSFARTVVLLSVNFRLFRAFEGAVIPYSLACNLAAATAFATFPLYGRLCDAVGARRFLAAGLLLNAPYLSLFLLVDGGLALTALWVLPLSAVVEVGQVAVVVASVPEERRASGLGLVGAAGALGTLAGTFLLARSPGGLSTPWLAALGGLVPLLSLGFLRQDPLRLRPQPGSLPGGSPGS